MSETNVKAAIMKYLETLERAFFWRAGAGMYSKSGISDILGVYKGVPVAIEVKAPGGKHPVTPNQKTFIESFQAAEGAAVVVTSVTEVKALIQDIDEHIVRRTHK